MLSRLVCAALAASLAGCAGSQPAAAPPPGAPPSAAPTTAVAVGSTTRPHPIATTPGRSTPTSAAAAPVVVLDPGHNGGNASHPSEINRQVDAGGFRKACDTTGTATDAGYPESAFALEVAQRAARLLRARGVRVLLTRSNDSGVGPCIDERAAIGNRAGAAAAVSIHADGGPDRGYGFHVIEPSEAPDHGNRSIVEPSRRLGSELVRAFGRVTGEPVSTYAGRRGVSVRNDLGGLNLSRVPKVFVECANMRNASDAQRLSSGAWRQRAAAGISEAILNYLGSVS